MEVDQLMCIADEFDHMNVPLDNAKDNGSVEKLFVNQPVAISYNLAKNPVYDTLNLRKDGYNNYSAADCVERFINEMLEIWD